MNRFFKGYGECIAGYKFLFGEMKKTLSLSRGELKSRNKFWFNNKTSNIKSILSSLNTDKIKQLSLQI
jgi:hypothetical protein